jgi:hypothetical protein
VSKPRGGREHQGIDKNDTPTGGVIVAGG